MKHTVLKLLTFVMACLIAMPLLFAVAGDQPIRQTVYISDNGNGDGSSPASPLGNGAGYENGSNSAYKESALYRAFELVKETGGKIVLCGTVTLSAGHTGNVPANASSDMNLPKMDERYSVTITSVDPTDDTDFRVKNGAKLVLNRAACPINLHFSASVLIENLTIATIVDSASAFASCKKGAVIGANCYPLTLGDGILCTVSDAASGNELAPTAENASAFPFIVGSNRYANMTGDTDLTIRSGTYYRVNGADYGIGSTGYGNLNGNVSLTIAGGTFLDRITGTSTGAESLVSGDISIRIEGGTFYQTICGCGPKGFAEGSKLYVNVSGGDFTKLPADRLGFFTTNGNSAIAPPSSSVISFQDYPAAEYTAKILNGVTQPDSTTRPLFAIASESASLGFKQVYAPGEERVIFVRDGGKGDGSSASSPLAVTTGIVEPAGGVKSGSNIFMPIYTETPLYQAFYELKDTGGTIVICGEINLHKDIVQDTATGSRNYVLPTHGDRKITVTSVWDGVDYRLTNGARIILERPSQLVMGGETEWTNMKLVTKGTGRIITCSGYKTVFSEGVICEPYDASNASYADHYPTIVGGERYKIEEYDTDLTVLSGTFNQVCGGSYNMNSFNGDRDLPRGSLTGDTHLTIGGTTVVKNAVYGTSNNASSPSADKTPWQKGNVYITVNGGSISTIYGAGSGRFANETAEVYIKVTDIANLNCAIHPCAPSTLNNPPAKTLLDLSVFKKDSTKLLTNTGFTNILPPTNAIRSVSLATSPDKTTYFEGDAFDISGMKLSFALKNGKTVSLACDPCHADLFTLPALTAGKTSARLWFNGFYNIDIPVTVIDRPALTCLGAQIKTANSTAQGLRFIASIDMSHAIKPDSYGFLVLPSEALHYAEELRPDRIGGAYRIDATDTFLRQEMNDPAFDAQYNTPSKRIFAGTFDEIDIEHFASSFTAVAYMSFRYGGEEHTVYSAPIERSVYEVAKAAYASAKEDADDRAWLKLNIIDRVESGAVNSVSESRSAAMRQKVVDYMWEMADVAWTPSITINYSGRLSYSTPAYEAGKTYYGLPYNSANGNAAAFSSLLKNGTLPAGVDTDWYHLPGNSCSTSILLAYHYAFNQLSREVGASNMIPVYNIGFDQVGSYGQPKYITHTGAIREASGATKEEQLQTLYKAYELLQPGDAIVQRWNTSAGEYLAHSRLIVGYPEVVRNADGTINGKESKLVTLEQSSSISQNRGHSTTWPHHRYTFESLAVGNSYVPITVNDMKTGFSDPVWCTIRSFNTADNIASGIRGNIESNYQIESVTLDIRSGDASISAVTVHPTFSKFCFLEEYSALETTLSALPKGSYTVVISAEVCGEPYELTRIDFSK
ncbi:MAG: hypothetical protein E7655_00485 [Ruminococcaceae bacterium]|nr:hypothetical protein [Oscillospiraceae bacterium]